MTGRRSGLFWLYAGLAAAGAVFPYLIFIPWLREHGLDAHLFAAQLFASGPAAIFASDVLYAALIFILFVIVEGRRRGVRHLWFPIAPVVVVGLCCAFPTFLAMRERAGGGAASASGRLSDQAGS